MRNATKGAGVLLGCVIFSVVSTSKASAESATPLAIDRSQQVVNQVADKLAVLEMVESQATPVAAPVPEPTKHVVAEGESLSKIAEAHQTTWQRLYAKNINLENPDILTPGVELVVPTADEVLQERAVPVAPVEEAPQATPVTRAATTAPRGSSSGNTYTWGYCTWYVKNRRPDLPNNLGNAYTWVSRAAAQGLATGSTPRAGAAGQRGNHVVYVESVNGDGTITISDMNYQAVGVVTTRTVSASDFQYIY